TTSAPRVPATPETVSPSAPTRHISRAFAHAVSDCRGPPSADRFGSTTGLGPRLPGREEKVRLPQGDFVCSTICSVEGGTLWRSAGVSGTAITANLSVARAPKGLGQPCRWLLDNVVGALTAIDGSLTLLNAGRAALIGWRFADIERADPIVSR